jgi:hypothetical protein
MTLIDEIKHNYIVFQEDWQQNLSHRISELPNRIARFERSYIRLTTIQAWRASIIEQQLKRGSIGFYAEAQNDALISHVQASLGSWRIALKSLRSCIENILLCLYYKDHEVELKLWEMGKFRIGASETIQYFQKHPFIIGIPDDLTGLSLITQQYKKLSEAVHASSVHFRMTEDGKALSLWESAGTHENMWETHEKKTIQGLNLLMLTIFKDHLQGTNLASLRQAVGFVIPAVKDSAIKSRLNITIKR